MLVTLPGDVDLDVRPGTPARAIAAFAGIDRLWCADREVDPDHPAGVAPLVHGARVTSEPRPALVAPPDWSGPVLRILEGPDAGGSAAVPDSGVTVGRAPGCDVVLDDPAVSARHVLVRATPRPRARDLGSLNGSAGPRGLPLLRTRRLLPGQPLRLGGSVARLDGLGEARDAEQPRRPSWAVAGAGLVTGIGIAAMTGRWYLALIGLAAPAALAVPALVARLRTAPATAPGWSPPGGPIAVVGEPEWARGYARAIALARGRAPAGPDWAEPWHRWLDEPAAGDELVAVTPGQQPPSWCPTVAEVGPHGRAETSGGVRVCGPALRVSEPTAEARARAAAGEAGAPALPRSVRWGDLGGAAANTTAAHGHRRMVVAWGAGPSGPVTLDLDSDGPHVLVAGTTGAGKSVALETLVAGLAHAHSPADLAIALVDFKGGAGLRSCGDLPHVCGTLTDLDGEQAVRVIAALSHELAERKGLLARRGLDSLATWEAAGGAPPRLLVVIDEYQEIVGRHPDFLPDLARLAAQGRSLGLHLVLATQRPAGAVTPEVRANVSSTLALRVASTAESRDLIGVPDAAEIPADLPGRGVLARGSARTEIQVAAPVADFSAPVAIAGQREAGGTPLAARAGERWRDAAPAPRLWLPALPPVWRAEPRDHIAIALADHPERRARSRVAWDPRAGAAVIVGPARSGRTSALRAIAAQAELAGMRAVWLPRDPREAARTLALAERIDDVLLLVDDAQACLTRLAAVDEGAAVDAVHARLQTGRPTALACAPHAPARLAGTAAVLAVMAGTDAPAAAIWGVPRAAVPTASARGRCRVRQHGDWAVAQLAREDRLISELLVASLPESAPSLSWAVGGDEGAQIDAPRGRVAVVGPAGSERDAVVASLPGATVTCHDVPHLVPRDAAAIVVCDPNPRTLRALAPRDWRGIAEPVPATGRCALIRDGAARAIVLGSA